MTEADDTYQYDAFISYSHHDKDWVHGWLLPQLEAAGLRVCIDYRDFEPGVPSLVNMENAVEHSRKTLIVLTPAWIESEWTTFESLLIQTDDPAGRRARMIPIRLKPCKPPKRIAMLTHVDFTWSNGQEQQMDRLLRALGAAKEAVRTEPNQGIASEENEQVIRHKAEPTIKSHPAATETFSLEPPSRVKELTEENLVAFILALEAHMCLEDDMANSDTARSTGVVSLTANLFRSKASILTESTGALAEVLAQLESTDCPSPYLVKYARHHLGAVDRQVQAIANLTNRVAEDTSEWVATYRLREIRGLTRSASDTLDEITTAALTGRSTLSTVEQACQELRDLQFYASRFSEWLLATASKAEEIVVSG